MRRKEIRTYISFLFLKNKNNDLKNSIHKVNTIIIGQLLHPEHLPKLTENSKILENLLIMLIILEGERIVQLLKWDNKIRKKLVQTQKLILEKFELG